MANFEEFEAWKIKKNTGRGVDVKESRPNFTSNKNKSSDKDGGGAGQRSEAVLKVVSHLKSGRIGQILGYITRDHHEKGTDKVHNLTNYIGRDGKISLQTNTGEFLDNNKLQELKKNWHQDFAKDDKKNARAMTHFILSSDQCKDPDEFRQVVFESIQRSNFSDNFDCVFAVHNDTDNLHAHVIINNYGHDGKKLHINKSWAMENRLAFTEVLNEHGYNHSATLKHQRKNLDKHLKEFKEHDRFIRNHFENSIKKQFPNNFQEITTKYRQALQEKDFKFVQELKRDLENFDISNHKKALKQIKKKLSKTQSTKYDAKRIKSIQDVLVMEVNLRQGNNEKSKNELQEIEQIKADIPKKELQIAEQGLYKRLEPSYLPINKKINAVLNGIEKNGLFEDKEKDFRRMDNFFELKYKLEKMSHSIAKKDLEQKINNIDKQHKKANISLDADYAKFVEQKELSNDIRLLKYQTIEPSQIKEIYNQFQHKIDQVARNKKEQYRLNILLQKHLKQDPKVIDDNKAIVTKAYNLSKYTKTEKAWQLETFIRKSAPLVSDKSITGYTKKIVNSHIQDTFKRFQNAGFDTEKAQKIVYERMKLEREIHLLRYERQSYAQTKETYNRLLKQVLAVDKPQKIKELLDKNIIINNDKFARQLEKNNKIESDIHKHQRANPNAINYYVNSLIQLETTVISPVLKEKLTDLANSINSKYKDKGINVQQLKNDKIKVIKLEENIRIMNITKLSTSQINERVYKSLESLRTLPLSDKQKRYYLTKIKQSAQKSNTSFKFPFVKIDNGKLTVTQPKNTNQPTIK